MCQPHQTRPDWTSVLRDSKLCQLLVNVNSVVVNHAHIVQGQPQRKGVSPAIVRQRQTLKHMNNVSCVDQLCRSVVFCQTCTICPKCCTKSACRCQTGPFLGNLGSLGAGPKLVQMLGYTLPFQTTPNLTRSPTIISFYVHPHRNLYLLEALHHLTTKMQLSWSEIKNLWAFITGYFWSQNQTTNGNLY